MNTAGNRKAAAALFLKSMAVTLLCFLTVAAGYFLARVLHALL